MQPNTSYSLSRFAIFTGAALKLGLGHNQVSGAISILDISTTLFSTTTGSGDVQDTLGIDVDQDGSDDIALSHDYRAEFTDPKMGFTTPATVSLSWRSLHDNYIFADQSGPSGVFRFDGGEVMHPADATSNFTATGLANSQPDNPSGGGGIFFSETTDQSGFLAFRLMDGTNANIGWLELTVRALNDEQPLAIDIGRVAYETIPNQPIEIGSTTSIAVPEPANFSLLAAGVASVALLRRRRAEAKRN